MSKLYLVNITEVYEGDYGKFYITNEVFMKKKDAKEYFKRKHKNFLMCEKGVSFDDEFTDFDDCKEYWWGESHWKITLSEIESK